MWLSEHKPWLNMRDVAEIFEQLTGSQKDMKIFLEETKKIAARTKNGAYVIKDEDALFRLLKKELPDCSILQKMNCWGEIMQLVD